MSAQFYPVDVDVLVAEIVETMDGELDHFDIVLGGELWSILERVDAVRPGHYDDPAITELFNWLVDPQRTVLEFIYVVGPLGLFQYFEYVPEHLEFNDSLYFYVGLVAAEAMALKSPTLMGDWEKAAWLLLRTNEMYNCNCPGKYGRPSNQLCDWIIHMMGDSKYCPNPYLRLVFLDIYKRMIYDINAHNKTEAFESTIYICSTLNMYDFSFEFSCIFDTDIIWEITNLLKCFTGDGYLKTFDEKLSEKLLSQVSDIIIDVSCSNQFKPNKNTGAYEMSTISTLFQCTSATAKQMIEVYRNGGFACNISQVPSALDVLVTVFKLSCQTPQLIGITAECFMDTLELVFYINIDLITTMHKVNHESLLITDDLLKGLNNHPIGCNILIGFNIATSPIVQALKLRYQDRLINLRKAIRQLNVKQLQELDLDRYIVLTCTIFY